MASRPQRVLLSSSPGLGHLYPLLPLGRALRAQGHSVGAFVSSALASTVVEEGFELLPAGPAIEPLVGAAVATRAELSTMDLLGMRAAIPIFADVRIELTLADFPHAAAWQPDLVISEHADFVGPLLAAKIGARHATLGFGPGHPGTLAEPGFCRSRALLRAGGPEATIAWRAVPGCVSGHLPAFTPAADVSGAESTEDAPRGAL